MFPNVRTATYLRLHDLYSLPIMFLDIFWEKLFLLTHTLLIRCHPTFYLQKSHPITSQILSHHPSPLHHPLESFLLFWFCSYPQTTKKQTWTSCDKMHLSGVLSDPKKILVLLSDHNEILHLYGCHLFRERALLSHFFNFGKLHVQLYHNSNP